jgi:S-adenosylmethionine-diacylglycerol 3-amino-3-carboxypropyl transferase
VSSAATIPEVDFSFVRYANCWEDAALLIKALAPGPGKRFLSIASAGDNSLSLLASGAEVIAGDLNPAQLACAELRKESIGALNQMEFLGFSGIHAAKNRNETYAAIRPALSPGTQQFWDSQADTISAGFIHGGKFERYFRLFRKGIIPLIHRKERIAELLAPKDQYARERFYEKNWNNRRWQWLFRMFFSRAMMGRLGRDPEFFRHVEGRVSARILERTRYALTALDTSKNPYLTYILTGNFGQALPHYLAPENYNAIRSNINKLTIRQGAIDAIAGEYGPDSFDGYNLSDIFEYLSPDQCTGLYSRLLATARPKARFAYWNMLVPRECPRTLADQVVSLEEMASVLFKEDRAFFYSRFVVEELR